MRVNTALVLLLCFSASSISAQQQGTDLVQSQLGSTFRDKRNITVAVMDFVNIDGKQSSLGRYFSEESMHYLLKRTGLRVVERSQIYQLESEWDLSGSGLISDDQIVEIGGVLGADAMVLGTLTPVGRRIVVHMRIVDTRTALVLSTGTTELSGSKYIRMYNDIVK